MLEHVGEDVGREDLGFWHTLMISAVTEQYIPHIASKKNLDGYYLYLPQVGFNVRY